MRKATDQLLDMLEPLDNDLLAVIGLDKMSVKNGPDDDGLEFTMITKKYRVPRKLKKMIKKSFGQAGYEFFRDKLDTNFPERFIQLKKKFKNLHTQQGFVYDTLEDNK